MAKISSPPSADRKRFVATVVAHGGKIGTLYRSFGIARSTAYHWWQRFRAGGQGALGTQRRGPRQAGLAWRRWEAVVLALRRQQPSWGPRKLRHHLRTRHPRQCLPSERTIARQLRAAGLVGRIRRYRRDGPKVPGRALTQPRRSNAVWTIDFKGHFRTGDGQLCLPLTVRDLFSRYLLLVEHVPVPSDQALRVVLRRCFRRYGVPRVMRVDNGPPFAGEGARGLSSLSVWWERLGIRVEFTRPAKPQDNGAHEQMHRVLKRETAQPPAADLAAQARRFRRFCHVYNWLRPHERLQMRVPGAVYRPAPAPLPAVAALQYPAAWVRKRVSLGGTIRWAGRPRMIGRAFKHEYIGLRPLPLVPGPPGGAVAVYLGPLLLGELHASDPSSLRPVRLERPWPRRS